MTIPPIEQALYGSRAATGYHFVARSPGFKEEWLAPAQKLCTGFGELPPGARCPEALYVQPFDPLQIAIVRVADRGQDDTGRPGTLAFHLLLVPRDVYLFYGGDPFQLADLFPVNWAASGHLPSLDVPPEPPVRRAVTELQKVLQEGDSPTLLGATQALVDGGRFVVQRNEPAPKLLRDLWNLLPTRSRFELWPATFAVNNARDFHAVVVHDATQPQFAQHVTEKGAGEYPEGRYELGLQSAIEAGDQAGMERMLNQRTSKDTIKMMFVLMFAMGLIVLVGNWLVPPPVVPPTTTASTTKPGEVAEELGLPKPEECPELSAEERMQLTEKLRALAKRVGADFKDDMSAEQLIDAIDIKLGTPHLERSGGSIAKVQHVRRQLMVLLYKHKVERHNDPKLNTVELLERLEQKLFPPPERMP